MEFVKGMNVHSKVDRAIAKQLGTAKVITARWIDTSNGDEHKFDYRAGFAGRAIETNPPPNLFIVAPPPGSFRMIFSICASNQSGRSFCRVFSSGVKRVYFFAKGKRFSFIEIFAEDIEAGDEHRVGRFNLCLYGIRDAAMNWIPWQIPLNNYRVACS